MAKAQSETERAFEKALGAIGNPKRQQFVREYLVDLNATQAAIRAGYSKRAAEVTGHRLLRDARVAAAVSAGAKVKAERTEINGDMVIAELAKVGFASLKSFMRLTQDGEPAVDLTGATEDEWAALSEATVEDFTEGRGEDARDVRRVKIKMHDKLSALDKLGRHFRLFDSAEKEAVDDALGSLLNRVIGNAGRAPIATQAQGEGE